MESVSFAQIGVFVACLIVAVGLAVALKLLLRRDPPLHREFVTREQHAELRREVEKLDTERRTSTAKVHDKIEAQGKDIAALKADSAAQTRHLQNMDTKMDQVLLRLPRPSSE